MGATSEKAVVFVGFTTAKGTTEYFAGESLEEIFKDTEGGKGFGGMTFVSYKEVTEEHIRGLHLEHTDRGIHAVKSGTSQNYWLGQG